MTTIKPASEAYKDSTAHIADAQKIAIAKAIDTACVKGLCTCFCKMSPEVATYLRSLGYSVDEQTNFGKIQGYQISWNKKDGEGDEPTKETGSSVEITLDNVEVISDNDGDLVIGTPEEN